jgi:hypothetical protein
MDYSELNSILNNLELKPESVIPKDTPSNVMKGSQPPSVKSMKDETNRRLADYNNQFNVKSNQEMVNTAGRYDFKSFMDTESKMTNDNLDLNDRLSQRGMFMPNNSDKGDRVNRVFDNLPIMTRDVKKKK